MRLCSPLLLSVVLSGVTAFAAPADLRPPPAGHWALDVTGKVTAATLANLDAIAQDVESSGAGQLGICVTNSTGGKAPRPFATEVFNRWGVGHHGANDGILLFVALGDHKAEIVLGDGARLTSAQTDVVMQFDLVPRFKRGAVDEGLLAGATSLARLMKLAVVEARVDETLQAYVKRERMFPERSPRSWVVDLTGGLSASNRAELELVANDAYTENAGRLFYLLVESTASQPTLEALARVFLAQVKVLSSQPVGVVAWDRTSRQLALVLPDQVTRTPYDVAWVRSRERELSAHASRMQMEGMVQAGHLVTTLLSHGVPPRPTEEVLAEAIDQHSWSISGFGLLGVIGSFVGFRRWNRRRSRTCEGCHQPRQLLLSVAEKKYLDPGQVKEESLGSVDYDVWWCGRCDDALVLDYSALFTSYGRCPQCGRKTKQSQSSTVQYATEYSGGLVQVDESCANCSYKNSYTRTTARLSSSSSSSSDSSWGSSSSSDSSFGGGSSSGGGSSGSW